MGTRKVIVARRLRRDLLGKLSAKKKAISILLVSLLLLGFNPVTFSKRGKIVRASFYSDKFIGKITASGEVYCPEELTAAHRTLPFGTLLRLRNLRNGRIVVVRINDRGPYSNKFSLDLSLEASRRLGITVLDGWSWVEYTIVSGKGKPSKDGP